MSLEREKDRYSGPDCQPQFGSVAGSIPAGLRGDTGRGRDQCGQATKGVWGMSGRQKATKGVEDCDKPGGAVNRALSPGSLNQRGLNP